MSDRVGDRDKPNDRHVMHVGERELHERSIQCVCKPRRSAFDPTVVNHRRLKPVPKPNPKA